MLLLRWDRVDRERLIFRVEATKTGVPLELPVTRQLAALLERRWEESGTLPEGWVFPSTITGMGHIRYLAQHYKPIGEAGVQSSGTTVFATPSSPSRSAI